MEALEHEIDRLRAAFWSDRDPSGTAFAPLADAYRRKGDLPRALDIVLEGVTRLPDFTSGHVVAGWIHRDMGSAVEAEEAFRRVLALDPENTVALSAMGELAKERGGHAEAAEYIRRMALLDPSAASVAEAGEEPLDTAEDAGGGGAEALLDDPLAIDVLVDDPAWEAAVPGLIEESFDPPPELEIAPEPGEVEAVAEDDLALQDDDALAVFDFEVTDLGEDPFIEPIGAVLAEEAVSPSESEEHDAATGSEPDAGDDRQTIGEAFRALLDYQPREPEDDRQVDLEAAVGDDTLPGWDWAPSESYAVESEDGEGGDPVTRMADDVIDASLAAIEGPPPADELDAVEAIETPAAETASPEPVAADVDPGKAEPVPIGTLAPDGPGEPVPDVDVIPVAELAPDQDLQEASPPEDAAAALEASAGPPTDPTPPAGSRDRTGDDTVQIDTQGASDDFQAWLERNSP